jgi:hypothetical protein
MRIGASALRLGAFLSVVAAACASAGPTGASPHPRPRPTTPTSETERAIVDAAWRHLIDELGKPARLHLRRINEVDGYGLVYATILGVDGRLFDYTGTRFATAAVNHAKSYTYVALLRGGGASWSVVDHAIGPTDMAWQAWAEKYGAPAAVLDVPSD